MPAPWCASSRCAETQRGAAVVLALVTVTIAAAIAAAVLADVGHALDSVQGRRDQAQARRLALAGVDWARNVLAADARRSVADHAGESWAIRVPPTPLGDDPADGSVGGEIVELSGRLNLNDLAPEGRIDAAASARLQRLLEVLGDSPDEARSASRAIAGWIAAGSTASAAPQAALLAVDEIARVSGIDAGRLARLAPFVTAVPAPAPVNLNTAPPEVLAALVPGLDLDAARAIAAGRERAWYRHIADFAAQLPEGARAPGTRLADVVSRHFLVTIHASHGVAVSRLDALLERREVWPEILWYRLP